MSAAVRMNRRLYLTADASRVVEDGDPDAATLLCQAGGEIPHATAARYGLLPSQQEAEQAHPATEGDGEEKASTTAKSRPRLADKSRRPEADK